MKLLALQAVVDMSEYLMERYPDQPTSFWCKGQSGAVLSRLYEELCWIPRDKTVSLSPAWKRVMDL